MSRSDRMLQLANGASSSSPAPVAILRNNGEVSAVRSAAWEAWVEQVDANLDALSAEQLARIGNACFAALQKRATS